ncbi:MAG TPA: exopolysaccharide biosynthesis protein [Oleiagrimonas sp.]|nr:exopolysaccharide biosynthesis protein [Oleiagrimonas sp.]
MTRPHGSHRTTTRVLRDAIDAQSGDDITLDTLLVPLRARAFGVMLLVFAIPNFIPVPIGIGGVMGVLTVLLGLQMLFGLEHPLVPAWLRRKSMHRTRVERFLERTSPITGWLERWCRPRLESLTRRPWSLLSGLALVILGVLLALPIPFTNYLFGVILLAFSFALLERDGALLLVMWATAAVLLVLSFLFSHVLFDLMHQMF